MKLTIIFIISIFSSSLTFASFSIKEFWDIDNTPKIQISCDNNENSCSELCDNSRFCEKREIICRDCIGTSILMTNIFEEMGTRYQSNNDPVENDEFISFLKLGMFTSFSSKSIYNQTDSYDSLALKEKFLSLCPDKTVEALVFFSIKNDGLSLDEVKYVTCDDLIFKMSDSPETILNNSFLKNMHLKLKNKNNNEKEVQL